MMKLPRITRIIRLTVMMSLVLACALPAWAQDVSGWYEGAAGYHQAYNEHKRTGKPLLLYFYAPWCGYCRTLDRTLLVDAGVQDFLKDYIKVRVYPEESQAAEWLARRLNVTGYPNLHVWYADNNCDGRVMPFVYDAKNDDWMMETPDGFMRKVLKACN